MEQTPAGAVKKTVDWKRRLGLTLLVYSFIPICTVELVALLPLTATQAITFGAVYLASGEIACIAAIAILGKPFVVETKNTLMGFVRRFWQPAAGKTISKTRHAIGITLLVASILPYYVALGALIFTRPAVPDPSALLWALLGGEALFFVSLVVLGEEFRARLKKLFEWPGRDAATTGGSGPGR